MHIYAVKFNDRRDSVVKKQPVFSRQFAHLLGKSVACERTACHDCGYILVERGHFFSYKREIGILCKFFLNRFRKLFSIYAQCASAWHAALSCYGQKRASQHIEFFFQKSRRRARLGGFERVGANEFGKRIAFVRARGFCGTHFVHFDGKTSFEKLQRALAPRKSAADNFYCLFAHIFCIIFIIEK